MALVFRLRPPRQNISGDRASPSPALLQGAQETEDRNFREWPREIRSDSQRCPAVPHPRASVHPEQFASPHRALCESDARVPPAPKPWRRAKNPHKLRQPEESLLRNPTNSDAHETSSLPGSRQTRAEWLHCRASRPTSAPGGRSVRSVFASTCSWASKFSRALWAALRRESPPLFGPFFVYSPPGTRPSEC